jgi:hypothetical protein
MSLEITQETLERLNALAEREGVSVEEFVQRPLDKREETS